MKRRGSQFRRGIGRAFWPSAALVGLWGGLNFAAFGRITRHNRKSRPNGPNAHMAREADGPGVSMDERLVEPLGANIPWGQLDQLGGKYTGVPYVLTRQIIILGRQADCDIILDDDRASRYHAYLSWDHGRAYVRDNHSLNGTRVNGQGLHGPTVLRHGDIVEVAGSEFRFTYAEATGLATLDAQPTEKIALPGYGGPTGNEASAPVVRARVTALTGPEPGRTWPIVNGVVTFGRGGDNLVVLPHASVSRHHAQIVVQAAGLFVQDIGSSNGTSVNGTPLVAPHLLQDNDHIQIGDITLVVKLEQSSLPAEDTPTQHLPVTDKQPGHPPARRAAMTRPSGWRSNSQAGGESVAGQNSSQFRSPLPTQPILPPLTPDERRLPRFKSQPGHEEQDET